MLVGFDYDGTLAPIVPDPRRVRMRRRTRRLLAEVARCYPCIVLSGRRLDDLARRLAGIPVWSVFGNHGLEPWAQAEHSAVCVNDWVRRLRQRLLAHPGIVIEDKRYSVTVHYRHVRNKARVRRAILEAVRDLPGARAIGGVEAVSVIPSGSLNKGLALQRARRVLACDTAIYLGDDETDEDAFTSAGRHRLLAIRIGTAGASRARYRLRAQTEIDAFLQKLLTFRSPRRAAHVARLALPSDPKVVETG